MNRRHVCSLTLVTLMIGLLAQEASAGRLRCRSRQTHCLPACQPCDVSCDPGGNSSTDTSGHNSSSQSGRAKAVHCLFIVGTADTLIASQVTQGAESMMKLFETPGLKEKVSEKPVLTGQDATPDEILKACKAIPSTKDDTIFVYYHGHGGTQDGQHTLLPMFSRNDDGSPKQESLVGVSRSAIMDILTEKEFRFICFVTDACSDKVELQQREYGAAPSTQLPIVSLMLDNTGILDINSSTYDEVKGIEQRAWVTSTGGIFTEAFVQLGQAGAKDDDNNGKISWKKEFLPALVSSTDKRFQTMKENPAALASDPTILNQDHQTPQVFPHD